MGRSRGGLTTKIHAVVDANGNPVAVKLSEGQPHDGRSADDDLLDTVGAGQILLADRSYDSDALCAAWIRVQPRLTREETLSAQINLDSYQTSSMQEIIDAWLPLTFAVNSLNRARGSQDLYPFVLSCTVIDKLGFVHDVVHARR